MPGRHQQRAEIGVTDAELTVGPGDNRYFLGREVGEADRDVHRGDDELGDPLEPLDIEGVVIAEELQQVDARQVAGRVVQVDVLAAIRDHRPADDVGVVARLGEVVGGLESARLAGNQPDGLVLVVPGGRRDDREQLPLLGGQAEADPGSELTQRPAGDPQVEAGAVGAVAGRRPVLADIAEAPRLGAGLVDPAGNAERGQQFLHAEEQFLGAAAQPDVPGPVPHAHGAAVGVEEALQEPDQRILWSLVDRVRHVLGRRPF